MGLGKVLDRIMVDIEAIHAVCTCGFSIDYHLVRFSEFTGEFSSGRCVLKDGICRRFTLRPLFTLQPENQNSGG
jgi:hypothetical protein